MSYTRFLYHVVFRTKCSEKTITEQHEKILYAYLYTYLTKRDCKVYRIGGMEDHLHILVDIPPKWAIADIMREMKSSSSHFLQNNPDFPSFNGWATGYAALSYANSELETVRKYIVNQKIHHRKLTTKEEIMSLIEKMGYDKNDKYFEQNV